MPQVLTSFLTRLATAQPATNEALFSRITTHCSNAEECIQERNYLHLVFGKNGYSLNLSRRTLRCRSNQSPPTTNSETCPPNMVSPTLRQKRFRIDCSTPSYLQFCHILQTDQITSRNTSKCLRPFANTETTECGVPQPMLELSSCLRWPTWSTVHAPSDKRLKILSPPFIA